MDHSQLFRESRYQHQNRSIAGTEKKPTLNLLQDLANVSLTVFNPHVFHILTTFSLKFGVTKFYYMFAKYLRSTFSQP